MFSLFINIFCCLLNGISQVGGRNTVLDDALYNRIPLVTDMPTIIFGADVTHPPPGEDSSASIAAVGLNEAPVHESSDHDVCELRLF